MAARRASPTCRARPTVQRHRDGYVEPGQRACPQCDHRDGGRLQEHRKHDHAATATAGADPVHLQRLDDLDLLRVTGGSKSVTVTAPSGCSWSTANDAASTWVNLSTAGGTGSGSVTVMAAANTGSARSATVTIAGKTVAVSESAVKVKGRK